MEELTKLKLKSNEDLDNYVHPLADGEDTVHGKDELIKRNDARGLWANHMEFFLSIMGYTVGIGSVWRFPILCSRNGGGVFLIPYFIFLLLAGWPLYYLEVCLGQFTGKSAGLAFEFCPIFKGLGFLQVTLSAITNWYLVVILAWVYYYLYNSVFPKLPWNSCGNWWNSNRCTVLKTTAWASQNISDHSENGTTANITMTFVDNKLVASRNGSSYSSPSFEFWSYNALRQSGGLEDMGSLQPHLVICLFLAWTSIILALCKGVKSLGKVVYVTATMPYILLAIMMIRGGTLEGAADGVLFFLRPDTSKLLDYQVWIDAAQQVFFSLGPSWGGVITMASYNRFHQKSFKATTACVVSSGFSSILNGFVVFTVIGFIAKETNDTVQAIASQSGAGLVFVVFPAAISQMPIPHLWSILFFVAMVTIVFDSLFGAVEVVSSAIVDAFPRHLMKRRLHVNIGLGLVYFLLGLPFTMNGGVYLLQLCDWYFSIFALLFASSLEAVTLCWIYGTDRFCEDIKLMMGKDAPALFRFLWTTVIPVLLMVTFFVSLARYKAPDYGDGYVYPTWAVALGILGGMLPIMVMIFVNVREIINAKGAVRKLLRPSIKWMPNDNEARLLYRSQSYVYENSLFRRWRVNIFGKKQFSFCK